MTKEIIMNSNFKETLIMALGKPDNKQGREGYLDKSIPIKESIRFDQFFQIYLFALN